MGFPTVGNDAAGQNILLDYAQQRLLRAVRYGDHKTLVGAAFNAAEHPLILVTFAAVELPLPELGLVYFDDHVLSAERL